MCLAAQPIAVGAISVYGSISCCCGGRGLNIVLRFTGAFMTLAPARTKFRKQERQQLGCVGVAEVWDYGRPSRTQVADRAKADQQALVASSCSNQPCMNKKLQILTVCLVSARYTSTKHTAQ